MCDVKQNGRDWYSFNNTHKTPPLRRDQLVESSFTVGKIRGKNETFNRTRNSARSLFTGNFFLEYILIGSIF